MRCLILIVLTVFGSTTAMAQRAVSFTSNPSPDGALIIAMRDASLPENVRATIGAPATENVNRAIARSGFAGEAGLVASFTSGAAEFGEIHLVGIGPGELRRRDWEDFGARASGLAKSSPASRVSVLAGDVEIDDLADAATGAMLGQYGFTKYLSEAESATGEIAFVSGDAGRAQQVFDSKGRRLAEAVIWTRDMQSEPANVLYPEEFVRRTREWFNGIDDVSISVLDERAMARLGMGAILGVGQGSVRPPRMMIVRYNGGSQGAAPIVFAGKGITFDSGGISIKGNSGMWAMKADMTGAAVVMGAVHSLAASKTPVNAIAIAALAENMPDGGAQRPGDVVRAMSGKTIEIMSTDAEGRLVLADAVWYAQEQYNPALLVDVATLTGSVGRALGDEYAGVFSRDDATAAALTAAGEVAGEDLWRLPLHPNHDKQIKSLIADVKNGDTGSPGASTGAAFIGAFIKPETAWAHLDIAGVDWRSEPEPTRPVGASGFGVRLLDELARSGAN
ncbi:leucyl aminopeptidase [Hyphococcus sp.]|uniref:leucyl aminopeptidase n=1 Tax=Hyphococcus sp. TaxID=2038636 RepID=UPI0020874893|nr:MAG: putative cytosol aminopeptidase [Marinicaulis sp.]